MDARTLAEQEVILRRWYEQLKGDDPHHCAEYEETEEGDDFPTTYGEYTFELFRQSPIIEAWIKFREQQWVKITDDPNSLPQHRSNVLVLTQHGVTIGWRDFCDVPNWTLLYDPQQGMEKTFKAHLLNHSRVTHWQPLPAPPEADTQ